MKTSVRITVTDGSGNKKTELPYRERDFEMKVRI